MRTDDTPPLSTCAWGLRQKAKASAHRALLEKSYLKICYQKSAIKNFAIKLPANRCAQKMIACFAPSPFCTLWLAV